MPHVVPPGRIVRAAAAALVAGGLAGAEPRKVVDLRYPPRGIVALETPVNPMEVYHLGDIDGDGHGDVLMSTWDIVGDPRQEKPKPGLIAFGRRDIQDHSGGKLLDLRHTWIDTSLEMPLEGRGVSRLGDLDGDGFGDFLLTSKDATWNGVRLSGLAMLVFGRSDFPARFSLMAPEDTGLRCARITSRDEERQLGKIATCCSDLNSDGIMDFSFSARGLGTVNDLPGAGMVFGMLGGPHLLEDIDAGQVGVDVPGFVLRGARGRIGPPETFDSLGTTRQSIAMAGDVNGDGHADLAAGAFGVRSGRGGVYLVLGGSGLDDAADLRIADPGGAVVEILGPAGELGKFGISLAGPGDIDGDGLADLVAGTPNANAVYVIFGRRDWPAETSVDDPTLRALRIVGASRRNEVGMVVQTSPIGNITARAGDWNGDGFGDFLFTAEVEIVRHAARTGEAYLVFGGPHLPGRVLRVEDVGTPALPGLVLQGTDARAHFGEYAAGGGEVNGDGREDVIVPARYWLAPMAPDLPVKKGYLYFLLGGSDAGESLDLRAVKPADGSIQGGVEASLLGSGLRGDETVRFGGLEASRVTVVSSSEIQTIVPPGTSLGAVNIEVSGSGGSRTLAGGFEYVDAPPYRDLPLDPDELRAIGIRSLDFTDSPWPPPPSVLVGQFFNAHFHDLDQDRKDELIVGEVTGGDPRNGRVSIIFGTALPPERIGPGETELHGTVIEAEADRLNLGTYLAFPGDVDGDGHRDVLLGGVSEADASQVDTGSRSGTTYLLFGRPEWPPRIRLSEELSSGGAVEFPNEDCGQSRVSGAGDLNGDGHPDFLLSYSDADCHGGNAEAHVYLGGPEVRRQGALVPGVITGDPTPNEPYTEYRGPLLPRWFGWAVSGGGDVNDDGLLDFLVGARHSRGAAYVVLGGDWLFAQASILEFLELGRGVYLPYEQQANDFGTSIAMTGDFDGDGIDDAVLGTPYGGQDSEGEAYVVYGTPDFPAALGTLSVLREGAERRLRMRGEWGDDRNGYVEALGDVNGDGLMDIGITGSNLRARPGRAYVVFGSTKRPESLDLGHLGLRGFRLISKEGNRLSGFTGGIAAGDFDGDGRRDLAVGEAVQEATGSRKRMLLIFGGGGEMNFVRGDPNGDAAINLTDAVFILEHLFQGGPAPPCLDAADTDDTGALDVTDAVYLLRHLFQGTEAPPAPYPEAGLDPTADGLDC